MPLVLLHVQHPNYHHRHEMRHRKLKTFQASLFAPDPYKEKIAQKARGTGSLMRFILSEEISKIDFVSNTQNLAGSNVSSLFVRKTLSVLTGRNTLPLLFSSCMVSAPLCRFNFPFIQFILVPHRSSPALIENLL